MRQSGSGKRCMTHSSRPSSERAYRAIGLCTGGPDSEMKGRRIDARTGTGSVITSRGMRSALRGGIPEDHGRVGGAGGEFRPAAHGNSTRALRDHLSRHSEISRARPPILAARVWRRWVHPSPTSAHVPAGCTPVSGRAVRDTGQSVRTPGNAPKPGLDRPGTGNPLSRPWVRCAGPGDDGPAFRDDWSGPRDRPNLAARKARGRARLRRDSAQSVRGPG